MLIKNVILSLCIAASLTASVQTVIFAAGKSTRLESKLLKQINGKPVLYYPIHAVCQLKQKYPFILVLGHQRENVLSRVRTLFPDASYNIAIQEQQLGTGHALHCTQPLWQADHIMVLNGDHPLTTSDTLQRLITSHKKTDADVSILIAQPTTPCNWGRIVQDGDRICIVEAIDFKGNFEDHSFVNAGYYIFKKEFLQKHIDALHMHENKGEYYVTDLIAIANRCNLTVNCLEVPFNEVFGINTQQEFEYAEQLLQAKV